MVLSSEDAAAAFGAILDALSRVVSPVLIDRAGWLCLREAVRGLPVDPGTGFGFELRLGDRAAGTDLYVAVRRGSRLAAHYVRRGEQEAPGSAAAGFGDHLAAIDESAPWAEDMGVEIDVTSGSPGGPPGRFVRIRSDAADPGAAGFPAGQTVGEWIAGAAGWRLTGGERGALERTFDALAAGGGMVDCVGIMPGRVRRAFKVVSRTLEPAYALPLLERLRWSGPAGEIAAFLTAFEGSFRTLRLAVGVTAAGVAPRVGLELFQDEPGKLHHAGVAGWRPFLARLCEAGLCLPDKMDALAAWPGRELVFRGRDAFGVFTGLHHVKVSFDAGHRGAGAGVEAKAYPAAGYRTFETIRSWFGR
ncbi:MAG: hypothetical protein OXJ62_12205 [Spirochaetaceae bacterium]|nr:hypothetical protein [Spirochaetaceae bacterium]